MLTIINPYNQRPYQDLRFSYETRESLEAKIKHADQAFNRWSRIPVSTRVEQVRHCLDYFVTHKTKIAQEITQQMGKPLQQALHEVDGMLARAHYLCDIAEQALAADRLPDTPGFKRRIEHVPLGVVLNIAAWNYPLLIAVNVVAPALLSGNSVLLKHSGKTPLCGMHFERAFAHLSVPHVVTHLVLDHTQTQQVIQDARIGYVAFTGSVAGGRQIYTSVGAHRFIDAGLELGGKDPAYIAADADLDFTVPNIVEGACYNAGQSCCAIERVYVHQQQYAAFLERAKQYLENYRLGDPMLLDTTMGPLASAAGVSTVERQVHQALTQGAQLLSGGARATEFAGFFYTPTLLSNVAQSCDVMQVETFGPVIPVHTVASDEQAVALMNDTRFGLTASIWTEDAARAERMAAQINAGTIFQNRCDYLDPALPWTGVGDSGKGATLSHYGFLHLTRRKSLHFRTDHSVM